MTTKMHDKIPTILKMEELGLFVLGVFLFSLLSYKWWLFPVLLLTPDLSMFGYLINNKIGAYIYNFIHFRIFASLFIIIGMYLQIEIVTLIGVILFSHIAMDRIFGYGLKYSDAFKSTHLGKL